MSILKLTINHFENRKHASYLFTLLLLLYSLNCSIKTVCFNKLSLLELFIKNSYILALKSYHIKEKAIVIL